jgi:spermidine synthase
MSNTSRRIAALFLLSVLGLFLEMMLIRWVSTEQRIFAYLQNTVLVVCFLGLGMGCWTCRKPVAAWYALVPLLSLMPFLAIPVCRTWMQSILQGFTLLKDFPIWHPASAEGNRLLRIGMAGLAAFGLMILLWHTFLPQGRLLGRLLDDDPNPVRAYSVNIAGSLAGIGVFVLLSALYQPPLVWCLVAAVMALPFLNWRKGIEPLLLASCLVLAFYSRLAPGADEVIWSPYQKLTVHEQGLSIVVKVNGSDYFWLYDLRPETIRANPEWYRTGARAGYYDLPALLKPKAANALVVGAGGGNDVAGLLRGGAQRIVAVEIDPAIIDIGRRRHAERPYAESRVEIVNDDARAYFARSTERFDVIVFGLLDAHTTTALMNARLDHFVYTRESFQQVRRLLNDGGIVVLCFVTSDEHQTGRFRELLRETFGAPGPTIFVPGGPYGSGGTVFIAGDHADATVARRSAEDEQLRALIAGSALAVTDASSGTLPTDDWPYLYLERPTIPALFGLLAGLMILLYVYATLWMRTPLLPRHSGIPTAHFFFLGAAFLLLETSNISRAAVVLGNTWDVNAIIIAAILLFILLANAVAAAWPRSPMSVAYAGLLGSCVALYFIDLAWFNSFGPAARSLFVGLLTCVPVFFSGIVFVRSFAAAARKDSALGANLLGALVGGLLQSLTFLVGIKALLLLVAGLYGAALLTRPRVLR